MKERDRERERARERERGAKIYAQTSRLKNTLVMRSKWIGIELQKERKKRKKKGKKE